MNIILAGNFLFPYGAASASRMRHFALGLQACGANVQVVSQVMLPERPEDRTDNGLIYQGIPYQSAIHDHAVHNEKRSLLYRFGWFRRFCEGINSTAKIVRTIASQKNIDAVIQYNRSYFSLRPFISLSQEFGMPLIQDVVEWPTSDFFTGRWFHPFYIDTKLAMHFSIPASDAVIAISSFLAEFYKSKGLPVIRIPAVIEVPVEKPEPNLYSQDRPFILTYVGSMSDRDGPWDMINAVRIVLNKGIKVKLVIIGTSGLAGTSKTIREECEADGLLGKAVIFAGRVSEQELDHNMKNADAFLFVRPDDLSARAAFPTRLPEYLTRAKPVITAGVGDIPEYLKDKEDACVLRPCNSENIAQTVEWLISNPAKARDIGLSGYEKAKRYFNYKEETHKLFEFIHQIKLKSSVR